MAKIKAYYGTLGQGETLDVTVVITSLRPDYRIRVHASISFCQEVDMMLQNWATLSF